jgi:hypothetical protein
MTCANSNQRKRRGIGQVALQAHGFKPAKYLLEIKAGSAFFAGYDPPDRLENLGCFIINNNF